ncbi:MAG TPA: PCRF domain-containing protein, partial [Longimicrobiales bacterium]|nr:PCRF domain-containing protein [Longimicrobiales bacterium]
MSASESGSSGGIFDIEAREHRLKALDEEMAAPGFWDDQDAARATIEEANRLKAWVEPWQGLARKGSDLQALAELLKEEEDAELAGEFEREIAVLEKGLEDLEVRTMLQGEEDHREAI